MSIGRLAAPVLALASILTLAPSGRGTWAAEPALVPGTAEAGELCGAETQLEALLARDPAMAARRAALEAMVRAAQEQGLAPAPGRPMANAAPIYTIPVVVHVVHDNGPENISDAQILSQIAAINRDCQNLLSYGAPAADVQLKFCLASNDASGNPVSWSGAPGITRTYDPLKCIVQFGNNGSDIALKQVAYFPSNQYLNVWVVKQIQINNQPSGIVGYATFPGTVPATQDGIVMDYRVMGADNTGYGTFPTLLPGYTEGKVFAHEVGHWLDLFHTFHGGCNVGDLVADTPPEATNNWNCPTSTILTCGNTAANPDPIHNFMEYTNDPCRYQFTAGQKTRMHAAIATYRSQLVDPPNVALVGACPSILFANVTLTPSQGCGPLTVQASAPPCGGSGCTYQWSAPNGSVANPTAQSTSITFTNPGAHKVTVTLTDVSNNTSTATATATVYVSSCVPIASRCANWVFGNNARLDFTSGYPTPVSGTQNVGPECATQISSGTGSLLFYTDNRRIWNSANAFMAGSMSGGNPVVTSGSSSHTGAIVIPRPGSSSQYFMFSVREAEQVGQPNPFKYHTIDMSLNGGFGALIQANTVIPLPSSSAGTPLAMLEGVTAIPHCNATDWWIVTAGATWFGTNDWQQWVYVTPVTAAGAGTTIAYPIGFTEANPTSYSGWGTITATRDGNRFAICQAFSQAIHVYDFDRATGFPSLFANTGDVDANQDVAFSPNGEILYYPYLVGSHIGMSGQGQYGLRQIQLSTLAVRTLRTPGGVTNPPDVELGPDDKIYSGRPGATSLDCINYPNQFNALFNNECGFNPLSVPLGSGASMNGTGSLPNAPSICSPASMPPAQFTYTVSSCNTVTFKTPNCSPWNWTFGDNTSSTVQNPVKTYAPGTYQVTLTTSGSPATMTQPITIGAQAVSISGPGSACGGPNSYTAVGPSSYTYSWTTTGGLPATFTGNPVLVSWGPNGGTLQLVATDPATGCTSTSSFTSDGCNACTKPPADMVAWWPLDETTIGTAQEIVAANDGQDVNAPSVVAAAVSNGRQFPGTNGQHVFVNDHSKLDLGTGHFTLDAWIRTSSTASFQTIVAKRTPTGNLGYALSLKNGRLALWLGDGSAGTEYSNATSAPLNDGLWHHVTATEDRFDASSGTKLYVDGTVVLFQPGYSSSSDVSNAEPLRIGARALPSGTTDWFAGVIDEVEIFTRALTGDEVMGIWGAGAKGKCKEHLYVPVAQVVCQGQASVLVPVTLCNFGPTASYQIALAGVSSGCTGAPPTGLQLHPPIQNNTVTVQGGGNCLTFNVLVTPAAMAQNDVSCFTVTATNSSSGVVRVSRGSIVANYLLCPRVTSGGFSSVNVGTPRTVTWSLRNTSPAAMPVPVSVEARLADGSPPGPGMGYVALNGLPPGVPWTSNYFLNPNDSVQVSVDVEFASPQAFEIHDIVLSADWDADGTYDRQSAAGLLYSERPLTVVAVPERRTSGRLELASVSPNPFRNRLAVEFELTRRGEVELALFDVGGRRVRTLVDGTVDAGRWSRSLTAAGLASGVYFLRLDAEGKRRTRRVVLLRE